jgi:hypothetical protein
MYKLVFNVLLSEKSRERSVPIYKHEEHNSSTEIRLRVYVFGTLICT